MPCTPPPPSSARYEGPWRARLAGEILCVAGGGWKATSSALRRARSVADAKMSSMSSVIPLQLRGGGDARVFLLV
eukprot:CAMPEP_0173392692 /NCGR_PEP_ID=MMETSP1356-20130122/20771_1 /TAXON_ID=77927 ORGANISM="Hemiselmis virescens, Strain PCC157" /NCGR_SAMPLE_ID=MMETSP1356 /ASSEMBLY_ACC=CAM_ASM_000847 /LENGTH=74 /DNA_ID=CAMNT_0014350563 /DNA_START=10 /DNA_END=234 /DNA_ORIENTATION=+